MGSVLVNIGWYLSVSCGIAAPISSVYFLITGETLPFFDEPLYTELALELFIIGVIMLLPGIYLIIAKESGIESGILYYLSRVFCGMLTILAVILLLPRMILLIVALCLLFFAAIAIGLGGDGLAEASMPSDIVGLLKAILGKD